MVVKNHTPLRQESIEEKLKETLPLLKILFGDRTILSVDARKLHAALNVRKRYTDWIKSQLDRGTWVEGQDYVTFHIQGENPQGGRPSSEYSLSMDMAKHITLMSHCRLGHAVRQYFLRVEEAYHDAREKQFEEIQSALAVRDEKFAEVQSENESLKKRLFKVIFPSRKVVERHSIPLHLLERLNARIEEAGMMSRNYPRELSAFIRQSLLIYFDVSRLAYLRGQTEYCEASFLTSVCSECFQHNNFDPSWAEDGYISFPVRNSTRTRDLRHPRMMDFPRYPRKGDLEAIRRYNEYGAEAVRHLLPPKSSLALPAPSAPLKQKETTVTSVITAVATFGGEASGMVEHREGKPYLTLELPVDEISAFWQHAHGAEEEVAARRS